MADANTPDPPSADALAAELLKMSALDDAVPPPAAGAADTPDLAALEALLKQAGQATTPDAALGDRLMAEARGAAARPADLPPTSGFDLPSFEKAINAAQSSSIDLLRDVDLNVKIELGRSRMLVEDVLKLVEGSVVELDKLAGDPVDVFVNDRLVARGEVLVLNDNFCVRVNEIVSAVKDEG